LLPAENRGRLAALCDGYSLECRPNAAPHDRRGLARLLRYSTQPAFAYERLLWEDARVVYQLPKPFWTGQTHVVLGPVEFMLQATCKKHLLINWQYGTQMAPRHSPFTRLFLTIALGLGACSSPAGTAVELDVGYDDRWNLTGLTVTAKDQASTIDPEHDVKIRVPDAWAGTAVPIRVWGIRGGDLWAQGSVTVTPILDRTVSDAVTLVPIPCGAWCTVGDTMCVGDGVATCQLDEESCTMWSEPAACGGDTPYCSLGTCLADCVPECADDETRCAGPTGVQVCGNNDSDTCRDWLPVTACADGETCSNGHCGDACQDECAMGEHHCVGGSLATCGDLNGDDCTEWGPPVPCPNASCSGDACQEVCTDDCNAPMCSGLNNLNYRPCGQYDLDPCRDLSQGTSCVPADLCLQGACSPTMGCTTAPEVCDDPPDPVCLDDTTLRTYQAAGTCTAGDCDYPHTDHVCAGGGMCSDGACTCPETTCLPEVISDQEDFAFDITVDETHVYWTTYGPTSNDEGDAVKRGAKSGGDIHVFASYGDGGSAPWGIALDDTYVYWTESSDNKVWRAPKDGDTKETVASSCCTEVWGPTGIAVDGNYVYWANGASVVGKPKSGGAAETLAEFGMYTRPVDLTIDNTHVYWTIDAGGPFAGAICRWSKANRDSECFRFGDTSDDTATRIAVDAEHVYWTERSTNKVKRWSKTTEEEETIASGLGEAAGAYGIALDTNFVYWTNRNSNQVMRRAKAGGPIETITSGSQWANGPAGIVVDATHIYWTNWDGGQVMRLSRCACGL